MHKILIPEEIVQRVIRRAGRPHPYDVIDPVRTALVVVDMQNYYVKPGYLGEVPMARQIIPAINRLSSAVRVRGGHVVWIKTTANDTFENWSVFNRVLMTPEWRDRRRRELDPGHEGHQICSDLVIDAADAQIVKRRFSAFIQGASDIVQHLASKSIDSLLIAGTATSVCCESSARDAMMLNFKVMMVADALATYTDVEHNASLAAFYAMFGDVQTVEEVIASLDRGVERSIAASTVAVR